MLDSLLAHKPDDSIPIVPVAEDAFAGWLERQDEDLRRWLINAGFAARPGSICLVPGADHRIEKVVAGIVSTDDPWSLGGLPAGLPKGRYHLAADWPPPLLERCILGWALGAYQFTRYKEARPIRARLAVDPQCDGKRIKDQARAIGLIRDLINTPPDHMMPENLAEAASALGREFDAEVRQIVGDELLEANFPAIHAVGRASTHPPRLIQLRWGDEARPKVTLVGKGVCFDSGGLDLKSAANMRLMKKDMGGAAHVLGLARLVMSSGLPVRLRVLICAVENAVSGNSYHPGDVIRTRKGLTIEIDNTDAEGRVILCDALAEAGAENPDLLIDFATLTGAARVALGTDVPALFSNADELAAGLVQAAEEERDPLWRLPLYKPYRELLDSRVADLANASSQGYAGAITAALFLQSFVPESVPWAHLDLMAWNTKSRPGRPEGGEAMGLRAVFKYLRRRYGGD